MKCPFETPDGEAMLLAYTSGKLDGPTKEPVELHLEACPVCREFVQGQTALWGALDLWEAPEISPDFDRRLYRKIDQRVSWLDLLVRPFRPALGHALPLAAAAGVIIMATTVLLDRPPAVPVAPPPAAQVQTLQPDQVEHALAEIELVEQFNHLMRSDPDSNPKM